MIKVGILTYLRAYNYGACLQAYGLQQALKKLWKYSEVIQYNDLQLKKNYKSIFHSKKYLKLFRFLLKPILIYKIKLKYTKFDNYISKKITLSKDKINKNQLKELNSYYDYFITWSDQIWNFNINNKDTSYLLDFVTKNRKKISYAASFWKKYQESWEMDLYRRYLSQYSHISVREKCGKDIIHKIGCTGEVHIDPVLLHDREFWLAEIDKIPYIGGDYIVTYYIQRPTKSYDIAKKIAQEKKYKLIHIGNNNFWGKYDAVLNHLWPTEFLNVLANAKHIITTSFHGLAFAIIFQKNFHYELSQDNTNTNARLENLIKLLNLERREITPNYQFDSKDIQEWGGLKIF